MNYNKLQQLLATVLLFFIFFNLSFHLPELGFRVFAKDKSYYDLVSIIVDEENYRELRGELTRYSKDISANLENTKVVILPVPKRTVAFSIASMNESLYYEGYKGLSDTDFESRLVGTILVGDVVIPQVQYKGNLISSVFPYTDFEDKAFIFDKSEEIYKENRANINENKAEVWHGYISPNTGSKEEDLKDLKNFFSKTHDFYTGKGIYSDSRNGNGDVKQDIQDEYTPYVFYFDQLREQQALNPESFKAYEAYREHKQDILYGRYTRDLAKTLKEGQEAENKKSLEDLMTSIDPNYKSLVESSSNFYDSMGDIQSRHITNNSMKNFLEVFAPGVIGDMRKDVFNAGRYNEGIGVNMDFIPYIISSLDVINDEIIKELNTELEDEVDKFVQNGLSRKIVIPSELTVKHEDGAESIYHNYLYGKKYNKIQSALDCSYYRGNLETGGQLVAANRAYNIKNIQNDNKRLKAIDNPRSCFENLENGNSLNGLFGKNSPFYLDSESDEAGFLKLKGETSYKGSIIDLYDPAGAKALEKNQNNIEKVPNPFMCFDNNLLLDTRKIKESFTRGGDEDFRIVTAYKLGNNKVKARFSSQNNWSCSTNNDSYTINAPYFFDIFEISNAEAQAEIAQCERQVVVLDGKVMRDIKYRETCQGGGGGEDGGERTCDCDEGWTTKTFNYKTVDSIIEHKSATADMLAAQIDSKVSPSLAIDYNRYTDFILPNGSYSKIDYANLFLVEGMLGENVSLEETKKVLDDFLNTKSGEIQEIRDGKRQASQWGDDYSSYKVFKDKKLFNIKNPKYNLPEESFIKEKLKNGEETTDPINLKEYIINKGKKEIQIGGNTKEVTYYDMLVFSLFWSQLDSIPAKYAFVFENYLNEAGSDSYPFLLPKNKYNYEIAYLGAPGSASDMMVGVDPDAKDENPFAEILSKQQQIKSQVTAGNIGSPDVESPFKCAPPDGVPITEWIPAVMCWLDETMDASISLNPSTCGEDIWGMEEEEKFSSCSGDANKNGISDCIEEINTLELAKDANIYGLNSDIELHSSTLGTDGNVASYINNYGVNYEIVKVETVKDPTKDFTVNNTKIIFDKSNEELNDTALYKDYISFSTTAVPTENGISQYKLRSKDKEVNIYIQSSIKIQGDNSEVVVNLESDIQKIEVRTASLFANTFLVKNAKVHFSSSLEASNKNRIYIYDSNNQESIQKVLQSKNLDDVYIIELQNKNKKNEDIALSYPLSVKVYDAQSELVQDLRIAKNEVLSPISSIKKSGNYTITVTDNKGLQVRKEIIVTSAIAKTVSIDTGSTIISPNSTMTSYVTIYDSLGNVAKGENYKIKLSLSNKNFSFIDTNTQELLTSTFQGYKVFQIKSANNTGDTKLQVQVFGENNALMASNETTISIIDGLKLEVETPKMQVGKKTYPLSLTVVDKNGKKLSDLNSRVYTSIGSEYATISKPYFDVKNGQAIIELQTNTLAGESIPISFQVEGIGEIIEKNISIEPEQAFYVDMLVSQNKIEASRDSSTIVQLILKDKYNNTVYTDSEHTANLEFSKGSKKFFRLENKNVTFTNGKAHLQLNSTGLAGIGYIKATVSPELEGSAAMTEDEEVDDLQGYSQATAKVQSFYFWNDKKIAEKNYNSLYTTLLGANYGDIEKENYLAGAIIFDENSRSLAVTSLLNPLSGFDTTASISASGNIHTNNNSSDLTQDIQYETSFNSGNLAISMYNKALNQKISDINYSFPNNTNLYVCGEVCDFPDDTSISAKSLVEGYNFYLSNDMLQLVNETGKTYFSVNNKGIFSRNSNINFVIDENYAGEGLKVDLEIANKIVGTLYLTLTSADIAATRTKQIFDTLKKEQNKISILLHDHNYSYETVKSGAKEKIRIIYNDIFSIGNTRGTTITDAYEEYYQKSGLGWKDANVTLLDFAAGSSVGEAVQNNQSIGVINIGDPVLRLKKIKRNFNGSNDTKQFDSTIGKKIIEGAAIEDYKIFDYNGDNKKDILLVKRDKYLQLLEKVDAASEFLDRGNLVYIADLGTKENIHTGNFSGNNYDSIFYVNKKGKPILLINTRKDFAKVSLVNKFQLGNSTIIRSSVFDMDNDGFDDIITLEDSGDIHIYYSNGHETNPSFQKKKVAGGYAIHLNDTVQIQNGLLYFDGLNQISEETQANEILRDNALYQAKLQSAQAAKLEASQNQKVEKTIVENIIFEQISNPVQNNEINSGDDIPENNSRGLQTYIKSEYANAVGMKVEKVFTDTNSGKLQSGDEVQVEITLTNTSGKTLNDVSYIERTENFLQIDGSTVENSKNLEIQQAQGSYDFMLHSFSLRPNESIVIRYTATTRNISYSYLKTGLFENGESGDDSYGDIVLQDREENCGKEVEIFRSIGPRSYANGAQKISCDTTKIPEALKDIKEIQENADNPEVLEQFAQEKLEEFYEDLDNDGIPDSEDFFITKDGNITLTLGGAEEKIEEGLQSVEDTLNKLSCGFNNGACIATPLNRAPLAPGNDPTFMGKSIGDGLKVGEGIPVFSALTGLQTMCGESPCCIRTVFPVSKKTYIPGPTCGPSGAGGKLGIDSPTNFFRFFVTPTLTGGVGTAACFGSTARVAGYSNMPGIAPLFPGGNCVVTAKPILGCSNDGSNGDPKTLGTVINTNNFGFINGTCPIVDDSENEKKLKDEYVNRYIQSNGSFVGVDEFGEAINDHSQYDGTPLITLGGKNGDKVSITTDDIQDTDFSDIKTVVNKRVSAFPSFLMDWMTAQIEEIVTKLTDFPTLFVILPDFSGIYDSDLSWEENSNRWLENSGNAGKNNAITVDDAFSSYSQTAGVGQQAARINSGVKEAYEFIASLPLVKIEQQPIFINIPWISRSQLDKKILQRKGQIAAYKAEAEKAKARWTLNGGDDEAIAEKVDFQINGFIQSLEKNIQILESYKEIPDEINKLLNKKEDYLDQIMCNVEAVSNMTSTWIAENGERFKAWVELYILIKAVLKSWQVLIDVFVDFEAECSECKNERGDLVGSQFKIIDMIVPKLPIVRFPKWPDIIVDLHNIRAGVTIKLPEFHVKANPLVLPDLPELRLPNTPNLDIDLGLPDLPTLPMFELPTLPDLPGLPTLNLPNLPPPPKLPKLFAGFSVATDIVKLVTKAMCIMKMSPFVPEWRAGDQIAFLTERNGFQGFDFFNLESPQFSLPFVDSIEVTSYVNLEYDTDFLIELAKQVAEPINSFSADYTNVFDFQLDNVDLRNKVPSTIDVDIDTREGGETTTKIGLDSYQLLAAQLLARNVDEIDVFFTNDSQVLLSNEEFKKEVSKNLSNTKLAKLPQFDEVYKVWDGVNNYSFSKEEKIIADLQQENFEKFDTISRILKQEIEKTRQQKREYSKYLDTSVIKVSNTDLMDYNEALKPYVESTFQKTEAFLQGEDTVKKEITESVSSIKSTLDELRNKDNQEVTTGQALAQLTQTNNMSTQSSEQAEKLTCEAEAGVDYNYKGIYVIEGERSYRLFDYTDGLTGKEKAKSVDIDQDDDIDLFYIHGNSLYMKENLSNKKEKLYLDERPYVVTSANNKFLKEYFIESVNNVSENSISANLINISFNGLTDIYNYSLAYFNKVDSSYFGEQIGGSMYEKQHIVDGIVDYDNISLIEESSIYKKYKNIASIEDLGNFKDVKVTTKEVRGIKENIRDGNVVFLSPNTKLYTGNEAIRFVYFVDGSQFSQELFLEPNSHIQVKNSIRIFEIIRGDAFIETGEEKEFSGKDLLTLKGLPLSANTKIWYDGAIANLKSNSFVDVRLYDGSLRLINFNDIASYELYDLGNVSQSYLFSLERPNDYYYAKIQAFDSDVVGTNSKQVLLAPQLESDYNEPILDLHTIKVPVYQKRKIDITDHIYEDSGLHALRSIFIDYNISEDSDKNGNPKDDNDSKNMNNLTVDIEGGRIFLEVGPFNDIFTKKISVNLIDINGNAGYKEVDFSVYAPNPEITEYLDDTIYGELSEQIESEPVNLYRYRAGSLTKLKTAENRSKVFTNEVGEFDFEQQSKNSGLVLTKEGELIANINEYNGHIDIIQEKESEFHVEVELDTADKFPKMLVLDTNGDEIYSQTLRVEATETVKLLDNDDDEEGIYVKLIEQSGYNYYILPATLPYNAGAMCIQKNNSQDCVVTVFKDGRIDLQSGYNMNYIESNNSIRLDISDTQGVSLAEVTYKLQADYIIR